MNYLHSFRDYVTPVLQKSDFKHGVLTPNEFVEAGDNLVFRCPSWKWCTGDKGKRYSFLPKEKQYLITQNVPCLQRCSTVDDIPESQDGEWTVYETRVEQPVDIDNIAAIGNIIEDLDPFPIKDISSDNIQITDELSRNQTDENDCEVILSSDGDDIAALGNKDKIIRTRTYDVYISYDKYYRTPRVWLFGYDERGNPLGHKEMFEDVSPDHAKKTVTYEYHPHERYMALSVHPCKHANIMKKLLKRMKTKQVTPEQYLFIFLKFIGTVIPTINYDFSISV